MKASSPSRRLLIAGAILGAALAACQQPPTTDRVTEVPLDAAATEFVGRQVCSGCHPEETELWEGSHHDLAMQEVSEETVLGDFDNAWLTYGDVTSTFFKRDKSFFVRTDGPDGEMADYRIAYIFGVEPLQQYLIEFPDGRLQALSVCWDTRAAEDGGQRSATAIITPTWSASGTSAAACSACACKQQSLMSQCQHACSNHHSQRSGRST